MSGWITQVYHQASYDRSGIEQIEDERGNYIRPDEEIQQIATEDYGCRTDVRRGNVYVQVPERGNYAEHILRATAPYWDRCAVVEANDTSDSGSARWYQCVEQHTPEVMADWTVGMAELGIPVDDHYVITRLGEYEEDWSDGRRQGQTAAAKASVATDMAVEPWGDVGLDFDSTVTGPYEFRYVVQLRDTTDVTETRTDIFDHSYEHSNDWMRVDRRESRHAAAGKATVLEREYGVETRVVPVPCVAGPYGSIDRELSPTSFPCYSPVGVDADGSPRSWFEKGVTQP